MTDTRTQRLTCSGCDNDGAARRSRGYLVGGVDDDELALALFWSGLAGREFDDH